MTAPGEPAIAPAVEAIAPELPPAPVERGEIPEEFELLADYVGPDEGADLWEETEY